MPTDLFDQSIRPQDDFFGYVNNRWLHDNPIPASENSWGTFYQLRDRSTDAVHKIIQQLLLIDPASLSHDQRLIRSFFESAMNFDEYAESHYATLHEWYAKIDAISSLQELAYHIGIMHRHDQTAFWALYVDHDDKNSQLQVLRFHQSGLTLPNRDYYIGRSNHMRDIRNKYRDFHTTLRTHLGELVPDNWQTIYDIEHRLAKAAWTNVALRDIDKNYNRINYTRLKKRFAFDWDAYSQGLGWTPSDAIVVSQPSYLHDVLRLLKSIPLSDIKLYLKWRTLLLVVMWLDQRSAEIAFEFFGTAINGTQQIKPLWKRAVQSADSLIIGEAIGREYAAQHFPESSKQEVISIVDNIRSAYHSRIDRLTWMSDSTKKKAHRKLDAMKVLIGYPSVWKDLSSLSFDSKNHLATILRARSFWTELELRKVGQKPAAEQWEMNAHTVNAYHHPNRLEIVFPAAILQPPFYDPTASYATNLGGIGAVIGHELTHGFDDQGADFDEHGNTNRWQTAVERQAFDALAQNIVDQANNFETVPGVFLQGKLILGEAIADIGGLELSIEALRDATQPDQFAQHIKELLVNFARCECGHATTQRLIELAKIDPHPPSPFRVNAVLGHIQAFYETFNLKKTDKLYLPPAKRAKIW